MIFLLRHLHSIFLSNCLSVSRNFDSSDRMQVIYCKSYYRSIFRIFKKRHDFHVLKLSSGIRPNNCDVICIKSKIARVGNFPIFRNQQVLKQHFYCAKINVLSETLILMSKSEIIDSHLTVTCVFLTCCYTIQSLMTPYLAAK